MLRGGRELWLAFFAGILITGIVWRGGFDHAGNPRGG